MIDFYIFEQINQFAGKWTCIDNLGNKLYITTNPSTTCNESSFVCPSDF